MFIGFILFCYLTANNYLNAQDFTPNVYPVGKTLKKIISETGKNPYCTRAVPCNGLPVNSSWDQSNKLSWWFQTTQESSYRAMGWALNKYFNTMQSGIGDGIPYNNIIPFIKWFIFGCGTMLSIGLIIPLIVMGIFIVGWVGGLFAFTNMNQNGITQFLGFCFSVFLAFCFGWVSIFPVIGEFFHCVYVFFFKQLALASSSSSSDSNKLSEEFTKRMSKWIMVFVIVAVIVAAMQLPALSAGVIGGIVLLAAMWFMKNKSTTKSA